MVFNSIFSDSLFNVCITLSFLYRRLYYSIVSNIKPLYIISGLGVQILIVVFLIISGSSLSGDIKPMRSSEESAFMSLKDDVISGNSLQFSITHFPRLEDALFEEWKKEKKDTSIQSFDDIISTDKLRLIGSLYEIYIDTTQIKNLEWIIHSKSILGFERTNLSSLIDVSNWPKGSHQLFVRIRLNREDYVNSSDPELKYYAMAYFLITGEKSLR